MKCAENIRQAVQQKTNKVCPVTISIGVTQYRGEDYNASVQRADQALYCAKNTGRNQVICL
ncbi:MAG: diguanylate cyclase [Lachnospiraceae bacterium]|nr:diguanylate cyclase [Lachnospiraceae bacterium]